ncbi:MAG: hypothetical protein M1834_000511 [Cirrosporium novae-zelandiae]|nr:MAG: hypothetical protein M1834_000511 [Cirrosporium novae-zelandiae]
MASSTLRKRSSTEVSVAQGPSAPKKPKTSDAELETIPDVMDPDLTTSSSSSSSSEEESSGPDTGSESDPNEFSSELETSSGDDGSSSSSSDSEDETSSEEDNDDDDVDETSEASVHMPQNPTSSNEQPDLQMRLRNFLGMIKTAPVADYNMELEEDDTDGRYIELDLGLGVFEEKRNNHDGQVKFTASDSDAGDEEMGDNEHDYSESDDNQQDVLGKLMGKQTPKQKPKIEDLEEEP